MRRTHIPKPGGGKRPLGIPTAKDRIVQGAPKRVLEPIFEWELLPESYGFRPGPGAKDALREVYAALKAGHHWVVNADLKGYFDSIPHDALMDEVQARISDGRVLALLDAYLKADILDGLEQWTLTGGTPQGVISPMLANLYPMLRGWFGYFKHAYRTEFPSIDGFVGRRLRAILSRHQHRESRLGRSREDHQRWTNAFLAAHGLFTMTTAHALASQSR